jgi:hypothetical protein
VFQAALNEKSKLAVWQVVLQQVVKIYLEVATWILDGRWYEILLKISGTLGVLLILRGFYFGIGEISEDDGVFTWIVGIVFWISCILFVGLVIAIIYVASK